MVCDHNQEYGRPIRCRRNQDPYKRVLGIQLKEWFLVSEKYIFMHGSALYRKARSVTAFLEHYRFALAWKLTPLQRERVRAHQTGVRQGNAYYQALLD